MTTLFEKNIEFLKNYKPIYAYWFTNMGSFAATPVWDEIAGHSQDPNQANTEEQKIININIGDRLLYPDGTNEDHINKEIDEYMEKPDRIWIGYGTQVHKTLRSNAALGLISDEGKARFKGKYLKEGFHDEILVCHGIGLGLHIKPLIEKLDVRMLFITETFKEFFYFSLFCVDWEEIRDMLIAKGGGLEILCNTYDNVESAIVNTLRDKASGQIDGLLMYSHYPSSSHARLRRAIISNVAFIGSNLGFFEDELVMLIHTLQNFQATSPAYFWYQKPRFEKETPIFIVGSGPSIDYSIQILKQNKDKVIILSCGTALRVLLKNGIIPDFHLLIENTHNQKMVIDDIAEEFDLSNITVVASASVYYQALEKFGKKVFFFRDFLCTEIFLAPNCTTINYAGPMVSNLGLRFAIGMGFKNIYLAGIDLGTRDKSIHHSIDSPYYKIEGMDKAITFKEDDGRGTNSNLRPANLGGQVISSLVYDITLLFKTSLTAQYPDRNFYNCSDGVRIKGFTPVLFDVVNDMLKPAKVNEHGEKVDLIKCFKELEYIEDAIDAYTRDYTQLRRKIVRFANKTIEQINEIDDFSKLISYLYAEIMCDKGKDELDSFRRILRGTIFIEVSGIYFFNRRLRKEDFKDLIPWFKRLLSHEIKDMSRITCEVLKSFDEREITKLSADAYDEKGFLHDFAPAAPLIIEDSKSSQTVHS